MSLIHPLVAQGSTILGEHRAGKGDLATSLAQSLVVHNSLWSTPQLTCESFTKSSHFTGGSRLSSGTGPAIRLCAQPPAAGGAQAPVAYGTLPAADAASAVESAPAGILHPFHSRGGPPHTAEKAQNGKEAPSVIHDWACHIQFKKYEFGGTFWVLIFIGPVPEDPSQWRSCPSFVGGHYAYVNSSAGQCADHPEQADVVMGGVVYLNKAIASRSGLTSFEPSVVVPYLKDNLHWRVQDVDRTAIDLSRLPSLEITVSSTHLTYTPGSGFPEAGEPNYHHGITHGRPGGARHAQA